MARMDWGVLLAMTAWYAGAALPEVEVADTGWVRGVKVGGQPAVTEISIHVAKPGWQGTVGNGRDAGVVRPDPGTGKDRLSGVGRMPKDGAAALNYTWSVSKDGDLVRFEYVLDPVADTEVAAVLAQVYLPIEPLAGREWVVSDGPEARSGTFPRELPTPYAFVTESGVEWFAWPCSETEYLALLPDWSCLTRLTVQDDRQFKVDRYEIQLYAQAGPRLEPGKPVRLGFGLRCIPATEVAGLRAKTGERLAAARQTLTCRGPASIRALHPRSTTVPAYGRFEVGVECQAEYSNPFDPADVAVEGRFVTPAGTEETVPGFYHWGYERGRLGQAEKVRPTGESGWSVRYCPRQAGQYRYRVICRDGTAEVRSEEQSFTASPSQHPGLVRVARKNPLYFETDNGEPYFAIGENVCWPGPGGTYDYDNYWQKLAEAGANYARLWIGPFDCFTLERTKREVSDPAGLGRIDLANAWRLDYVIEEAEKRGLRIMFCIDSFNSLRIRPDHAMWDRCPYNAANGGPLARPEEFFTDARARDLFRRRLRYIVARWSHSPAILSWEFWNEVNIIEKYESGPATAWHREMAQYLREIDPYAHLITTSWAGVQGDPRVDALPEIDYIQSHQYGARDEAGYMARICLEKVERFRKPHYFGEFGTGTRAEGTREDEEGIHLHNGLWSGVMSNAAGTGMLWWWDNYVEPRGLYHHFLPVARFVKGIPFNTSDFRPVQFTDIGYADPPPPTRLETLDVPLTQGSWGPAPFNQPLTITIGPDGRLPEEARPARVLHGTGNHPTLHNPVTFMLDYPKDGEFIVQIEGVSGHGGANLRVHVDDRLELSRDFVDADTSTDTIQSFSGPYPVKVAAGPHRIRVVNDGKDWCYVSYRIPEYRRRTDPGVQVFGLRSGTTHAGEVAAIVWIKNEQSNWYHHNQGLPLLRVPPTRCVLANIPAGTYEVEWWDTTSGTVTGKDRLQSQDGKLALRVPELTWDVAAKLIRLP